MLWKIDQPDLIIFLGWSIFHNLHIYYQNSKLDRGSGRFFNFAKYEYLFNTKIQNSKLDRGSGRILNFAKYHYL